MEDQAPLSIEVAAVFDHPLIPAHTLPEKEVEDIQEANDRSIPVVRPKNTEESQNIVEFEADDPQNSVNWPLWYKWVIVALFSTMTMIEHV